MKPFNLEEAKAGNPVCTREGNKARILCTDFKGPGYNGAVKTIVAAVEYQGLGIETLMLYTNEGLWDKGKTDKYDLMMEENIENK